MCHIPSSSLSTTSSPSSPASLSVTEGDHGDVYVDPNTLSPQQREGVSISLQRVCVGCWINDSRRIISRLQASTPATTSPPETALVGADADNADDVDYPDAEADDSDDREQIVWVALGLRRFKPPISAAQSLKCVLVVIDPSTEKELARTEAAPLSGLISYSVGLSLRVADPDGLAPEAPLVLMVHAYLSGGDNLKKHASSARVATAVFTFDSPASILPGTNHASPAFTPQDASSDPYAAVPDSAASCTLTVTHTEPVVPSSNTIEKRFFLSSASAGPVTVVEKLTPSPLAFSLSFQLGTLALPPALAAFESAVSGALEWQQMENNIAVPLPSAMVDAIVAAREHVLVLQSSVQAVSSSPLLESPGFKPSTLKTEPQLGLVPTNLQTQTMSVDPISAGYAHVTTTVGAFAAHPLGFKSGGTRQLLARLEESDEPALSIRIQARRDLAYSQALATVATSLLSHLDSIAHDPIHARASVAWTQLVKLGFLFQVESLLSTQGKELGMLGDMDDAVKHLSSLCITVNVVVSRDSEATVQDERCEASVVGLPSRDHLVVRVFLPPHVINPVDGDDGDDGGGPSGGGGPSDQEEEETRSFVLSVVPLLFTQGINEMQTLSNILGNAELQDEINAESLVTLQSYYSSWVKLHYAPNSPLAALSVLPDIKVVNDTMTRLASHILSSSSAKKNADILMEAADLIRILLGARVTVCKSAKDRTSMSVTHEEARILHRLYNVAESDPSSLLRAHGVRRENAFINVGKRSYAFNAFQSFLLPSAYKPPSGTGGSVVS